MKMTIKGMQVTRVEIKKECRELHGIDKALEEAFSIIKKRYTVCANQEINKNATFFLYLTIDSLKTESKIRYNKPYDLSNSPIARRRTKPRNK